MVLGLISCSRTHLALRFADDVIAYEISDQFDFSGIQDQASEKISEEFISDLKKELIPFLVEEIKKASVKAQVVPALAVEVYEVEIKKVLVSFEEKMKSLQPLFKRYMLEIVEQINEENWRHYLAEFEKKNTKILKEKRNSRLKSQLERFFGRLTEEQMNLVEEFETKNQFDVNIRVANRQATIKRFQAEIGPSFSKEKLKEVSEKWLNSPGSFGDSNAQAFYDQRHIALVSLVAKILHQKTEKQTKHLVGELSKIEKDLFESLPPK